MAADPKTEDTHIHSTSVHEEISVTHTGPKLTPRIITLIIVTLIILLLAGVLIWKKPFANLGGSPGKISDSIDSIRNLFRSGNDEAATSTQQTNYTFSPYPNDSTSTIAQVTNGNTQSPFVQGAATTTYPGEILDATSTIVSSGTAPNPFAANGGAGTGVNSGSIRSPSNNQSQTTTSQNTGQQVAGHAARPDSIAIDGAREAAVAGESVYRNATLGFQMTLPSGWSSQVQDLGSRVLFFSSSGARAGYVETYDNVSGVTLDDITATIQGSPDVTAITQTSISNIPAIRYTGSSRGIALIYNNKIFYLHDQLADPTASNNIKFF